MRYSTARKDSEYLENLIETVDCVALMDCIEDFMEDPTKTYACGLYAARINLWFSERVNLPCRSCVKTTHEESITFLSDKRVQQIAKRHEEDIDRLILSIKKVLKGPQ